MADGFQLLEIHHDRTVADDCDNWLVFAETRPYCCWKSEPHRTLGDRVNAIDLAGKANVCWEDDLDQSRVGNERTRLGQNG